MTDHTLVAPEWLSQEGLQTLSSGYLLPGETPRAMIERVSQTASKLNEDPDLKEDLFECLWNGWVGLSSPVAANFGTNRALPISCLETGTKVLTEQGYKEIQNLKKGDKVLTHLGNWKPVLNVWSRQTDGDLYFLSIDELDQYGLNITGNHPVFTQRGWVKVKDLDEPSDKIYISPSEDGGITLSDNFYLTKQNRETTVWDIEVADDHSFIAQGIVVHNCYSVHISDRTESIFSHRKETAMLSKNGGGVGVWFGDIRPSGAPISGGGKSSGIVPWMQGYDQDARIVNQGGVRRGSFALYAPIEHHDFPEVLLAKDHTKGDPRKWIDSNIGVTVSDSFMEDMIENGGHKQELFGEVIRTRLMSGSPYMVFIDNVNKQNPACYKERNLKVSLSNLCFTGDTLVAVADGRKAVPIKELTGTEFYVYSAHVNGGVWVKDIQPAIAFRSGYKEVIELQLENGDKFKCTPDHKLALKDATWVEARNALGQTLEPFIGISPTEEMDEISMVQLNGRKVVAIRNVGPEDVYELTVEENHNFYIITSESNGVLVSNCSEITLFTDENHTFVCVLSSMNLSRWFEWKDWRSPRSGRSAPEIAIHLLEAVVTEFIKKAEHMTGMGRAVRFAKKSRALGLGTMGLHSLYQSQMLPFKSQGARALNIETHKFIREQADKASQELAERFGEPEWCVGSGFRHSHRIAIAPTKTNSVISGAYSEGIAPIDTNYFVAKQDKGTFVRKNPHLERIFCKRGIGSYVWDKIERAKGSVKTLDCLTEEEKEVFLTAREIDQFELIKQAADRQPFVCQAQSLNLFLADPNVSAEYLLKLHISAWAAGVKSLYYLKAKSALIANAMDEEVEEPALVITRDNCPWCVKLKLELHNDGIDFIEVSLDKAKEKGMWSEGWKTVPQLYLNNNWVGGYTDYMNYKTQFESTPTATVAEEYGECQSCQA